MNGGVPVLGVVAGFLRGERAGQPGDLDPDRVVQVFLSGVDCARNYERHTEQTGPVLLGGQEVQLCAHLRTQRRSKENVLIFKSFAVILDRSLGESSSHHLPVHSDDVADERTLLQRRGVSVGEPVAQGHLGAAGNQDVGPAVGDEGRAVGQAVATYGAVGWRGEV